MLRHQTVEGLRRMKLSGMAAAFLVQVLQPVQEPSYRDMSFEERFGLLVDQESSYPETKRLKRFTVGDSS